MGGGPSGSSGGGGDPISGGGSTGASLCDRGCAATLEADCPNGPADHAECVEDCEALSAGACGTEYAALQSCAEGETITCSSGSGIPVVEACSDEQQAFIACLN